MRDPHIIVKRPLVTEKGSFLSERSNMYTFEVVGDANKVEIRKAIESLFKVNVVGVNTAVRKGKVKGLGWRTYARPNLKRALVKLKPGQTIEFV
jgi:large subunit ribosomal protein L23